MKKYNMAIAAVMMTGLLGACSTTPQPGDPLTETRVLNSGVLTVKAKIIDIDYESKMLTLDNDGKQVLVVVSEAVNNFDKLKVGDVVETDYKASTAVYAQVGDGSPRVNSSEQVERGQAGQAASEITETVEVISDIVALDKENRVVTLIGPQGQEVTTPIKDDDVDLSNINVGDQVVVVHTRAIAVSIRSATDNSVTPASATKTEDAAVETAPTDAQ